MRRWAGAGAGDGGAAEELEETWDAVVLAVAFYATPSSRSSTRTTSRATRRPGAARAARAPGVVHQSVRRPNFPGFPSLPDARIQRVAPVGEYTVRVREDGAHVADARRADGRVLRDLDVMMFGTGYRPIPDFVRVRAPPFVPFSSASASPSDVPALSAGAPALVPLTAPTHIPALFRYTLYAHNPSLGLVGAAFAAYTPFALAWAGAVAYATRLRALLAFEAERMDAVARVRAASLSAPPAPVDPADAPAPAPAEPSALVSYAVLDAYEEPFAALLRVESARRWTACCPCGAPNGRRCGG
ncbi:hypothetical protein FB451DRAFT_1393988 [Mycena latifolia]|nr:hypothetical protein FB451DRAFT_1393988 [Mycena latifolia]